MTQLIYCRLATLSFACLLFTLFQLETLTLLGAWLVFTCLFLQAVLKRYLRMGILEILPSNLRQILLETSLSDLIRDIVDSESLKTLRMFFHTLINGFFQPKKRFCLQVSTGEMIAKFQAKGLLKIMPKYLQKSLLGEDRMELEQMKTTNYEKSIEQKLEIDSTQSSKHKYKKLRRLSLSRQRMQFAEVSSDSYEYVENNRPLLCKARTEKSLLTILKQSLGMIKSLLALTQMPDQIRRISFMKLTKLSVVFWILVIMQIRLNPRAKELMIKALMISAGVITVIGAITTTAILTYNYLKKESQQRLPSKQIRMEI